MSLKSFRGKKTVMKRLVVNIKTCVGTYLHARVHAACMRLNMPLCIAVRLLYFFPAGVTCISWRMVWRSPGRSGSHWLSRSPLHGCLSISASGRGSAGLAKWVKWKEKYEHSNKIFKKCLLWWKMRCQLGVCFQVNGLTKFTFFPKFFPMTLRSKDVVKKRQYFVSLL